MQSIKLYNLFTIKSSWAISHVNAELKNYVSETGSGSITRVNVQPVSETLVFNLALTQPNA
jgi:hypothetical protein